ncbi:MAG TPA: serine/threonine protein kinase [Deltaproteobacteria bacterium]|nr:serine/threonine protein kinase [Deltaproteobacteria bacterium]
MTTFGDPSQSGRYFIGRYEVVSRLREEELADVWLCRGREGRDPPRFVEIKSLRPDLVHDRDSRAMFVDEGHLGQLLNHPNIVRIEETGELAGMPYWVQEHIEGPSVRQLLRRQRMHGPLELRLAVRVALDVAKALHHAHTATDPHGAPLHVVHRDVSPSNILVSNEGRALLVGFGVARFDGQSTWIQPHVLKGKLRFMAPETILRDTLSVQTDLYGLGVVLHMLCTAGHAWSGEAIGARLSGSIPGAPERRPDLPQDLEDILTRLLEQEPARRYRTATDLVGVLSAWLERHGPVYDAELASSIDALFPESPTHWHKVHNTATYGAPAPPRALAPPRPQVGSWVPLLAIGGIGGAALGLLTLSVVVLAVIATVPGAEALVAAPLEPPPSPEANPVASAQLLDAAEAALAEGDLEATAANLASLSALGVLDPALWQRQELIGAQLHVQARLRSIERLLDTDPGEALAQARGLDDEFPGEPGLAQLIARAEAALAAPAPQPWHRAPVRSRGGARPLLGERVSEPLVGGSSGRSVP